MPINILMPALSPTMEKGNLAKWLKKEGDKVKAGDILAEIETDKATMEYEAVDEGVIAKILVPEGTADIAVNQPIAVLAAEGEDVKAAAAGAAAAPSSTSAQTRPAGAPQGEVAKVPPQAPPSKSPHPEEGAKAPVSKGQAAQPNGHAGRVFASPLARRLAKAAGIEVGRVAGTGPRGRVIARDVEAAKSGGAALRAPAPSGAPTVLAGAPIAAPAIMPMQAP